MTIKRRTDEGFDGFLTARIPIQQKKQLRELAKSQQTSIGALVRLAIELLIKHFDC